MTPKPLTVAECDRLMCPAGFARAVELGYVAPGAWGLADFRKAIRQARAAAILRGDVG